MLGVLQKLEEIDTKVDAMDTKFEKRMDCLEASSIAEDRGSGNIMKTPPKLARKNLPLGSQEESLFEQETPNRHRAASATMMSTPPVVVSEDKLPI